MQDEHCSKDDNKTRVEILSSSKEKKGQCTETVQMYACICTCVFPISDIVKLSAHGAGTPSGSLLRFTTLIDCFISF